MKVNMSAAIDFRDFKWNEPEAKILFDKAECKDETDIFSKKYMKEHTFISFKAPKKSKTKFFDVDVFGSDGELINTFVGFKADGEHHNILVANLEDDVLCYELESNGLYGSD